MNREESKKALMQTFVPQRSLFFYTLTSVGPLVVFAILLLFMGLRPTNLVIPAAMCALVSMGGFWTLLYEITFDIAGVPEYKLPVWAVFYLVIYLLSGFAFVIFALHSANPGTFISGMAMDSKAAFLDALYLSMSNYIGVSPDVSFSAKTQGARFLAVTQGILSVFLNVVIITKFVSSL
jgi:hypothetical protein